jgi:electron transfer flavoprotein alpha subunit
MPGVLVVAEQRDGKVKRIAHETLAAARAVADNAGGDVHALVIGPSGTSAEGLGNAGADKVALALDDALALYQGDRYATIVAARAKAGGYAVVLLGSTALGKDLGPRVAARLGCPLANDVTSIVAGAGITVTRPVYSGKAVYTMKISAVPCVVSVRPNVFAPGAFGKAGVHETVAAGSEEPRAKTVQVKEPERAALDVAEASIVVSGGRGLKGPENFHLIEELAAALGGATGASRAVVDAGWRPHAEQVGQTGKTVSPNLYFAVGISGAIQHLAGMRSSKIIVAINKDADAPIFKIADYGIVGDLFEILPKLTEAIKQARGN